MTPRLFLQMTDLLAIVDGGAGHGLRPLVIELEALVEHREGFADRRQRVTTGQQVLRQATEEVAITSIGLVRDQKRVVRGCRDRRLRRRHGRAQRYARRFSCAM